MPADPVTGGPAAGTPAAPGTRSSDGGLVAGSVPGPGLTVFTTGGTIDKLYFDALSKFEVGDSTAPAQLAAAGVDPAPHVRELLRKDSLELTGDDRALIAEAVAGCDTRAVVLTHGTDTMADTALAVRARLGDGDPRTVVFTGAMRPARMLDSDAAFNLGFAVAAARLLPPGVHLAMHGRVFDPAAAHKDRQAGRFVADTGDDENTPARP